MNDLYRTVIFEHTKHPRNKGLKGFTQSRVFNPSCGDDVVVEIKLNENIIEEINFEGHGCNICCSSASILTEIIKGKTIEETEKIMADFTRLLKGETVLDSDSLEDANSFSGVRNFPARIKCATAPWKALEKLIYGDKEDE